MSLDEAKKYFKDDKDRECKATNFAKKQGAWTSKENKYLGNCDWWLRSPGGNQYSAAVVHNRGRGCIDDSGFYADHDHYTVRPALYINL